MRLYYYKDSRGNFGDDLNPWLWGKLYPEILDGKEDELFVGIGTLLNHRLPKGLPKHIFGSGHGYGTLPDLNDKFIFHAVRGPLTAHVLGLPEKLAITDSAVLIRTVNVPRQAGSKINFGFIPHAASNIYFDWSIVCNELEFLFIDARENVDNVLKKIQSCDVLLCEAMHGAIVADALRVPWIPVICYDYILEFKWNDWLASIGMEYRPHRVTSLYHVQRNWSIQRKLKSWLKCRAYSYGIIDRPTWDMPPHRTGHSEFCDALSDLRRASESPPCLSHDALIESLTVRYVDILETLKRGQGHA